MPRISEFLGIVVAMDYVRHAPPHVHARYGEHEALIALEPVVVLQGCLPRRALALVFEWVVLQGGALQANWRRAAKGLPVAWVAPLE